MQTIITASLAGRSFRFSEPAYNRLDDYLQAVEARLEAEERDEIINDLEGRIAELLLMELNDSTPEVTAPMVRRVIERLGEPDEVVPDVEGAPPRDSEGGKGKRKESRIRRTRLLRDTDRRIVGGVCAGLSPTIGLDVRIVRLLFILLSLMWGAGAILYLVLWIAIPSAPREYDRVRDGNEAIPSRSVLTAINHLRSRILQAVMPSNDNIAGQRIISILAQAVVLIAFFLFKVVWLILVGAFFIVGLTGIFVGVIAPFIRFFAPEHFNMGFDGTMPTFFAIVGCLLLGIAFTMLAFRMLVRYRYSWFIIIFFVLGMAAIGIGYYNAHNYTYPIDTWPDDTTPGKVEEGVILGREWVEFRPDEAAPEVAITGAMADGLVAMHGDSIETKEWPLVTPFTINGVPVTLTLERVGEGFETRMLVSGRDTKGNNMRIGPTRRILNPDCAGSSFGLEIKNNGSVGEVAIRIEVPQGVSVKANATPKTTE